jgi:hypothetical protein
VNILDKYKKMSEKLRHDAEQTSQADSGMQFIRCMRVIDSLQLIHTFLHELIGELNYVEPEILVDIPLDNFGTLNELRQGDYKLVAESNYRRESVSLFFTLNNDQSIDLEIEDNKENQEKLDHLKDLGLLANYTSRQPTRISIQGYVPIRIEFYSDFEESNIHLIINNFSRLGAEYYLLNTEHVTEELLDNLGRFITRENNDFMKVLVEDSQGISLAQPVSIEGETGSSHTAEMDISRLRSLFNREQRLYLTYHNQIKDIGSRSHGIILGRAKDCELIINSDLASRHHAQLVFRKGKFVLVDQSTNGTFVKPQGGKEVYVQSEALPLSGSGFISLGKAVTVDNEHLIYYSCQ